MRYATVRIQALNAGTGEVIRNMDRAQFEAFWKRYAFGEVPTHGVGGVGDGIIGFSYKIYSQPYDVRHYLNGRLLNYKICKLAGVEWKPLKPATY